MEQIEVRTRSNFLNVVNVEIYFRQSAMANVIFAQCIAVKEQREIYIIFHGYMRRRIHQI
jgi:hypothetical protein